MSNQFEAKNKDQDKLDKELEEYSQPSQAESEEQLDISDEAFKKCYYVKQIYSEICREYNQRIDKKFAHLTKAKSQFPPYWDDDANEPAQLPMYQHNVSSGRYAHSITQIALTYNSFFPNGDYAKSLLEIKLLEDPIILANTKSKQKKAQKAARAKATQEQGRENQDIPNSEQLALPDQAPKEQTQSYLHDNARLIEQGYDNVIKQSSWAKKEHLKMVSDMMHYSCGIYYREDPSSYRYKALDFRKCRFPSGTTTDPDEWEYMFIEHEISFFELVRKYEKKTANWNNNALKALLNAQLQRNVSQASPSNALTANTPNIDNIREGLEGRNISRVCPTSLTVVSCFWKNKDGKISTNMHAASDTAAQMDNFLYEKDNLFDDFSEAFSIFPADESEPEIRMQRGWGDKIHALCHAYDRAFCKFLDHVDYSATLFIEMDPNDLHKKIMHFGSLNVGRFESIQSISSGLNAIIAALTFLDAKIDSVTFTRGLNKTELIGEGRGAELASILLTMEGRVHKHLQSRFNERYTIHHRRTLQKIINISLSSSESDKTRFPEVQDKFYDFLMNRNVPKDILQVDDRSSLNSGLPSNWIVQCRKTDASGITSPIPAVMQTLQPYISSLPESGFKVLLSRIIADAFGDEDLVDKLMPGSEIATLHSEADLQIAEMQASILTSQTSDFDKEVTGKQDVNPEVSDAHKFQTFPPSKENDHIVFSQVLLSKVDDAVERFQKKEIGRPTLHIWMYNLVSTTQGHVNMLKSDQIRSNRTEAQQIFQRFGQAFNMLRQVESQANADRQKKLEELQTQIQQSQAEDPEKVKAQAALIVARAKQAEVSMKYNSHQFDQTTSIWEQKRAEESHMMDNQLKGAQIAATNQQTRQTALEPPPPTQVQGGPGRPANNVQDTGIQ